MNLADIMKTNILPISTFKTKIFLLNIFFYINLKLMKIIAMIPARIGSKRVKKKNLRLINNKPLISYVLETIKKTRIFNDIYINSDSKVFEKIAKDYSVNFYKRDKKLGTDKSTNDEFTLDFLNKVECDILIQILPTSPFITEDEINRFCDYMIKNKYKTLVSVEEKKIACLYKMKPINFKKLIPNPPSQTMIPVKAYATVLMGWDRKKFLSNMKKYNSAYHGGNGKTGYFTLTGLSTLDIDEEEDFQLVEKIMLANLKKNIIKKRYYKI